MDRGARQATVHGVAKESGMTLWLNNHHSRQSFSARMFYSAKGMGLPQGPQESLPEPQHWVGVGDMP